MNRLSRFAIGAMVFACFASVGSAKAPSSKAGKVRSDTAASNALQRAVDSLAHMREIRTLDSARGVDSAHRVSDSLHRVDSMARAAKTWYVVHPNHEPKDSALAELFHHRLCVALRRTGKVQVVGDAADALPSWEASWQAARTAGAGKVLMPSLRFADGRATVEAWISSSSEAGRFDSVRIQADATEPPAYWALDLVKRLFPSPADSSCRADSGFQANLRWSLAPSAKSPDSAAFRMLSRRLGDGIRQSGRATWIEPDPALDSLQADSALRAAGVARRIHLKMERDRDSAWVLDLRTTNLSGDTLFDSLKVVDPGLSRLVARAVPELLPAPPSCGSPCVRPSTRSVWSVALSCEKGPQDRNKTLASELEKSFRARTDRQFLSLPDSLSGGRLDSTARSRGVSRLVRAHLSGSDSTWILSVSVRDLRTGAVDSGLLRRGGPSRRVFPWMARHLAAWSGQAYDCDDSCRIDSLREQAARWAVVTPPPTDSVRDPTAALLAAGFPNAARIEILATLPGCAEPACLDSLAASRGLDRLLWTQRWRIGDSTWALQARVSDVVSDVVTDSVTLVGGIAAPDSSARAVPRIWAVFPHPRRCDSCVSRDTLEAALVVEAPRWDSASDEGRAAFRDSAVRTFATNPTYQLVEDHRSVHTRRSDLDSASRSELVCKSGAVYRMRSELRMEDAGWRVIASIEEVATGKIVASVDYQDKSKRADRPPQLAAWATRRLLGIETREKAPDSAHDLEVRKMLKLGIPAAVGILAVLLHW